jgi:hypothetical protein
MVVDSSPTPPPPSFPRRKEGQHAVCSTCSLPELAVAASVPKLASEYYLVYGIYLSWAKFVKKISNPQGRKRCHFAKL